jgi:DNA modification methylase
MTISTPPPHHNRRLPFSYERLETLRPYPKEVRTYNRATRRAAAKMIRRCGPPPMMIRPDRVVLTGNLWLEAAIAAGYEEAPVMVAEHLSPDEATAFMLANIKLVERGAWDAEALGELLLELSVGELALDLDLTGFEPAEIDLAIDSLNGAAEGPDPADELPPAGPPVSRLGDLWRLCDRHVLLCGSALERADYERLMGGEKASIVVSDPPYNFDVSKNVGRGRHENFVMASGEMSEAEFTAFLTRFLTLAAEFSADPSLAYVFIDWRHMGELMAAGRHAYDSLVNLIVWAKQQAGLGSFYRSAHELIFLFKKGNGAHRNNVQLGRFGRDRSNVWSYPSVNGFRHDEDADLIAAHPTPKCVQLLVDVLLDATVRGDLALDPFAGSGSLIIAAEKIGRRARAIELYPPFVDLAVRRWQRWSGEAAILDGDGRSFAEIEAARAAECGQ